MKPFRSLLAPALFATLVVLAVAGQAGANPGDEFGQAVAACDFNGDGFTDLAIGASEEDNGGAVHVLYGGPGGVTASDNQVWTQNTVGVDGSAEAGDQFGSALAAGDFDGDGFCDLAIGVPGENDGGIVDAGAVNVLYGTPGGLSAANNHLWDQNSLGVQGGTEGGDRFGSALAVGDLDGDGFADLAIGVPGEDVGTIVDAGAVNVLYGSRGGLTASRDQVWDQNKPFIEGAAEVGDEFGSAVAISDFNGDGFGDLAIGVPGEDVGAIIDAGAVNVLYGGRNGLSADGDQLWDQNRLDAQGAAETGDRFGSTLAAGDFDGDGFADLAIGAPEEDIGVAVAAGAVNILYGSRTGLSATNDQFWHQNKSGVEGSANANDRFGSALATGDFDRDGFADLAIGVPWENAGAIDAGAVNVLYGAGTGLSSAGDQLWHQNRIGVEDASEAGDHFGSALTTGDFDHDGFADLAVGIPHEDVDGDVDAGAVQVFYGGAGKLSAGGNQIWDRNKLHAASVPTPTLTPGRTPTPTRTRTPNPTRSATPTATPTTPPCAVTALTLEQEPGQMQIFNDNPAGHGGGVRIFPGKGGPTNALQNRLRVRATINAAVPAGQTRRVFFRVFDIDHFSNPNGLLTATDQARYDPNGIAPNDNVAAGGAAAFGAAPAKTAVDIAAGQTSGSFLLTINDRQPGNNWQIVAECENEPFVDNTTISATDGVTLQLAGVAVPAANLSPRLTVWRELWVEHDRMAAVNFRQGPVNAQSVREGKITAGAGTRTLTTNISIAIREQFGQERFNPGRFLQRGHIFLFDCGIFFDDILGTRPVTANSSGAAATVTLSSNSPAATDCFKALTDDDVRDSLAETPLIQPRDPDLALLDTAAYFTAAFVQVKPTTGSASNARVIAPFDLNVGDGFTDAIEEPAVRAAIASGKDVAAENDFWLTYVLGGYQGRYEESNDGINPAAPASRPSATTGIQTGGSLGTTGDATSEGDAGAIIYLETIRDVCTSGSGYTCAPNSAVLEQETVAHEIAHGFGAMHGDGDVMGTAVLPVAPSSGGPGRSVYSGRTLRRIITSNHPGFGRAGS